MKLRLTLSSYLWLLVTLICTIRAIYLYRISTKDLRDANKDDPWFFNQETTTPSLFTHAAYRDPLNRINNKPENIFYFVQISDLHISKFQPKGHTVHFLHFLQSVLPLLKPEFVVVTGDLIDAKDKTGTVSEQFLEEWKVYQAAVDQKSTQVAWHDMRGNHDCFDLMGWEAENNYYKQFGKSSKDLDSGKGVYQWEVLKPFGNYSFVALDSCPKKGPSRPFNFFGYLTTNAMNNLVSKILPNTYNHTFLFGHYPTTTLIPGVSSEGYTLKDLASHFSIYFCGHLHRLVAGLGDVLQSYDRATDTLELELSDMKDHGSYRIVAVDHDLISFVDVDLPIDQIPPASEPIIPLDKNNQIIWPDKIQTAPVILITNPKDSRFTLPSKEPLQFIHQSSHIRFLVFSEHRPGDLEINIFMDNKPHSFPIHFVGSKDMPLYTSAWDPNDFDDLNTHSLRIEVVTPDRQTSSKQIPFRLDNMRVKIDAGTGGWVISISLAFLLRGLSIFAISAMILCLILPKLYNDLERQQDHYEENLNLKNRLLHQLHHTGTRQMHRFLSLWLYRFLSFPDTHAWSGSILILFSLLTLPWFRAEFIPSGNGKGDFYLWGLLFGHEWVSVDTWLYAIFQLTFSVAVLILLLVWKATPANGSGQVWCDRIWGRVVVLAYWAWRWLGLGELATLYGGVYPALVLNVLVWWLLGVGCFLLYDLVKGLIGQRKYCQGEAFSLNPSLDGCRYCQEPPLDSDHVVVNYLGERFTSDDYDSSSSDSLRRAVRRNGSKRD